MTSTRVMSGECFVNRAAQKGHSARPQGVWRLRRAREGTSQGDARLRTMLGAFFSSPIFSSCPLGGTCKQDDDLHRLRRFGSRLARIYGHVPTEQGRLPVRGCRVDSIRWRPPPVPCGEHFSADCLCEAAGLRQCLVSLRESRSAPGSIGPIQPSIRFPSVQS